LSGTSIRWAVYCDERGLLAIVSVQLRRIALKDLKGVSNALPMRRGSMVSSMPSSIKDLYPLKLVHRSNIVFMLKHSLPTR